ncbi:MAG: STAS domain-containing protein [Gammaproteobacteria bacterium]|nr:STAS domain-containing protein [Gammaproteobacteria bacterium]MDH5593929.1 STAS domain-containing protein [Gammaproteobacteria bacterium]MDH5614277.1 STAS domain-containing protein [Gammaproteobacteria bacterium]
MEYNISKNGTYSVIMLEGEVDLYCSPDARKIILKELKKGDDMLIDLSKVSYIDSSGIACLVEGYQVANKNEIKFALLGVSQGAMNVLKLARLDNVFTIYNSFDDIK